MTDLPKDWEAVDSKDGIYYWHTVTGEVTWKRPKQPAKPKPPPPPPLPNSPIISEPAYDPYNYNYTDNYTQAAFPNYQPVQTCYQNVVLLKEPSQEDLSPSTAVEVKTVDNYENVELIQKPPSRDEIDKPEDPAKPSLDRYKGPSDSEDPYTCITKFTDRKSNFRHSAVKRKLSNNVEELVITREKVDVNGADETPDVPIRSSSFYDDEEICEDRSNNPAVAQVCPEDADTQFAVPFSDQYEEVEIPVLINDPHSSLNKLPSYNKEQDPLLTNQWETNTTQSEVNNQSRDSGISLTSSSRVNSYQANSPVKSTITERPGTLYENVELPFENDTSTTTKTLPEGWKQVDSENGDVYYWHIESGVTQWHFPDGQPLSPEPVIGSKKTSVSSQPSTPLTTLAILKVPLPEQTNIRSFSAWLLDIQDINSNDLKHGNCTNIIENCIQGVSDRLQGDQELEQEVVLQVSPGVLRELDAKTSSINKAYSITRIRAWGCSRENSRYFAYIIRHSKSQEYKCHIYKCASSAKSLTLALKEFSGKPVSDSSSQSSPNNKRISTVSIGENELSTQQMDEGEQYQRFNVTFLGSIRVAGDSGIELICSSLDKLNNQPANWIEATIDIFTTHFRVVETTTGEVLAETRVRFLSFLGLSNDDSMCGYITGDDDTYFCLGFKMDPNSIQLSLAMKNACESRFQRVCKAIPDDSIRSNSSSLKKSDINILNKAEVASEKIGVFFKSKMSKVSKQVGHKLQRTSSAKTIYGTYQVQLYGSAQVPIDNDKKAVEEAISYLESQSSRVTNPHVIEFQITQGGFLFIDKEKRKFTKKVFSLNTIRYCLKKGHSVAFVVMNKSGLFDAYAFGEINTNASVIIETIQTAVNENV